MPRLSNAKNAEIDRRFGGWVDYIENCPNKEQHEDVRKRFVTLARFIMTLPDCADRDETLQRLEIGFLYAQRAVDEVAEEVTNG